jgi:hypothetical protein
LKGGNMDKNKDKLKEEVLNYLGEDFDLFDFEAEYDFNLTLEENRTLIFNKLKSLFGEKGDITKRQIESQEAKNKEQLFDFREKYESEFNPLTLENLKKVKTIAIFGDTGSGKTSLAFKIIETLKDHKQVYFLKHPKPFLLKEMGFRNLVNLEAMQTLQDAVVYLDEPQLFLNIYEKKANKIIAQVCSLARQRNITLIISSSDTRVFTKWNESYFDLWLVKDLDYSMVKQGSKIRKIYKDNSILDPNGLKLNLNEYLSESRPLSEFNGKHKFKLSNIWKEEFSNPYRI